MLSQGTKRTEHNLYITSRTICDLTVQDHFCVQVLQLTLARQKRKQLLFRSVLNGPRLLCCAQRSQPCPASSAAWATLLAAPIPTNPAVSQDVPLIDILQAPTKRSKRMAVSYAATDITGQDCGLHGQMDVAEPGSGSSSDQQGLPSVYADQASCQTFVERSVSLSTEALPAVMLPANQPASFSIIISDDSSQLTRKRERSSNLIHLSGKQAPPDTSKYPFKRQATSYVMQPGSRNQGHDCLHSEPAVLSHEHIQHHNHFQQQQQLPDMVQAGSCNFDSLPMYAPTGLADSQAQRYSTQAPDAQQPPQQAAWTSAHLQPDQSS
jgi:hypothetical protein